MIGQSRGLAGVEHRGALPRTPDASAVTEAGSVVHPHVDNVYAMLDSPDDATIGELATLIQSISRDLSFYPAALRDVIETDIAERFGPADPPLGRAELAALGDLLSAQAHVSSVR